MFYIEDKLIQISGKNPCLASCRDAQINIQVLHVFYRVIFWTSVAGASREARDWKGEWGEGEGGRKKIASSPASNHRNVRGGVICSGHLCILLRVLSLFHTYILTWCFSSEGGKRQWRRGVRRDGILQDQSQGRDISGSVRYIFPWERGAGRPEHAQSCTMMQSRLTSRSARSVMTVLAGALQPPAAAVLEVYTKRWANIHPYSDPTCLLPNIWSPHHGYYTICIIPFPHRINSVQIIQGGGDGVSIWDSQNHKVSKSTRSYGCRLLAVFILVRMLCYHIYTVFHKKRNEILIYMFLFPSAAGGCDGLQEEHDRKSLGFLDCRTSDWSPPFHHTVLLASRVGLHGTGVLQKKLSAGVQSLADVTSIRKREW